MAAPAKRRKGKPSRALAAKSGRSTSSLPARHAKKPIAKKPAAKKPASKKPAAPPRPRAALASQPAKRPAARRPNRAGSTASSILNNIQATAPTQPVPRKWARHHRILCQLRDTLLEQSGRLVREAHEEAVAFSMHMADSGTDSFDRDFALSLLSADQNALAEVQAAILRIHQGQYGVCEMTGAPIAEARLEAIPWTRYSYDAQQRMERSGVDRRVHLGDLRTVHGTDSAEPDEPEEEGPAKPDSGEK